MTSLERVLLQAALLIVQIWGIAAAVTMIVIVLFAVLEQAGAWMPAAFAGYAISKCHRQCEAEAELAQSLPIARLR